MKEPICRKWRVSKACVGWLLTAVVLTMQPSPARAQEQEVAAAGKREFQWSCAVCHGLEGRGGSVMKKRNFLTLTPADLTELSKRNKGQFPFWRVYDVIDGRLAVRGHGDREMPIWGNAFQEEEISRLGAETKAVGRILSIVFYLQSIQKK